MRRFEPLSRVEFYRYEEFCDAYVALSVRNVADVMVLSFFDSDHCSFFSL